MKKRTIKSPPWKSSFDLDRVTRVIREVQREHANDPPLSREEIRRIISRPDIPIVGVDDRPSRSSARSRTARKPASRAHRVTRRRRSTKK